MKKIKGNLAITMKIFDMEYANTINPKNNHKSIPLYQLQSLTIERKSLILSNGYHNPNIILSAVQQ